MPQPPIFLSPCAPPAQADFTADLVEDTKAKGGLPSSGAELAVFVTLSSASGDTMSNQALPV